MHMKIKFKRILMCALAKHRSAIIFSSIFLNETLLMVQNHAISSIDIVNQKMKNPVKICMYINIPRKKYLVCIYCACCTLKKLLPLANCKLDGDYNSLSYD